MKTVIMAGGRGTRISNLFPDIPKPLIPIKDRNGIDKPVLEWEIRSLVAQGFDEIILTVSYLSEQIINFFGNGDVYGAHIEYFVEEQPLGNAGALLKMRDRLGSDPFLLLNADAVFDVDFNRMVRYHHEKGGLVTLFTHPNSHPYDSGIVVADENGAVLHWLTKEDKRPEFYKNRVNAGLHVINPQILDLSGIDAESVGKLDEETGKAIKVDLDRQLLKPLCNTGHMYCYDSPEYVKDMGTPERYEAVSRDFAAGVVESKSLSHKQKAIFLDRDGTINKYVGFLSDIDQFELIDGAAEAIRKINESGYLCIVATNQPVIARGEVTTSQLQEIHNKMETELGKAGAYIDGLYYCPHHPDKGFEGEIPELKFDCECRKPKPGMLVAASKDFNIDLSHSWMIGDGKNDVGTGKAAGCNTLRIITDEKDFQNEQDESLPTAYVDDLLRAVKLIEVLDKIDRDTVDPKAQYVLFNRNVGQALWLFKKNADGSTSPNGEMFVGKLVNAITLLIHQDNSDDFDLLTLEQYFKVRDRLNELRISRSQEIKESAKEVDVNDIEYGDFLLIDILPGLTTRIIKFITYLEWLMRDDFKALRDKLCQGINLKKEPKRNANDAICGVLATTDKDFMQKSNDKEYYFCNFVAIMYVVRYVFTSNLLEILKVADKDDKTRFLVKNYQSILIEILRNVEDLFSLYSSTIANKNEGKHGNNDDSEDGDTAEKSEYYSSIRSRFISTVAVHQVLRQEIYGSASFHAFADKELSACIGTIRQLIELRIRRSFGILSLKDTNGNIVPLDMSKLFEVVSKYRSEIEFPIKLENIIRIYRWSNNYIHSGLGDYPWIPMYLELMLRDFSFGQEEKDGSWSVYNGIKTKRDVLDSIAQELLDSANTDKDGNKVEKYTLYKCKPECRILKDDVQ